MKEKNRIFQFKKKHEHNTGFFQLFKKISFLDITEEAIFERNVPHTIEILRKSVIAIAGCGGIGSNAAVSLARAGIGKLIIADFDVVELSNLNRQHYFISDLGLKKVDALTQHLFNITPFIQIEKHDTKVSPQDIGVIFSNADILIEAFDRAESKQWLIEEWCKLFPRKPIICASGIGGFGNTEKIVVRRSGNIIFCGDEISDMSMGLCAPRVSMVSDMQANIAIELLLEKRGSDNDSSK